MKPVTKMAGSVLSIGVSILVLIIPPSPDKDPFVVSCINSVMLIWIGVCIKDFLNAWVEGTK